MGIRSADESEKQPTSGAVAKKEAGRGLRVNNCG
jgi:hypothetical protein